MCVSLLKAHMQLGPSVPGRTSLAPSQMMGSCSQLQVALKPEDEEVQALGTGHNKATL